MACSSFDIDSSSILLSRSIAFNYVNIRFNYFRDLANLRASAYNFFCSTRAAFFSFKVKGRPDGCWSDFFIGASATGVWTIGGLIRCYGIFFAVAARGLISSVFDSNSRRGGLWTFLGLSCLGTGLIHASSLWLYFGSSLNFSKYLAWETFSTCTLAVLLWFSVFLEVCGAPN